LIARQSSKVPIKAQKNLMAED